MLKSLYLPLAFSLGLSLASCSSTTKTAETTDLAAVQAQRTASPVYQKALHFWDNFDFTDSLSYLNPAVGEQHLVDFLALTAQIHHPDSLRHATSTMLQKAAAQPNAFQHFVALYDRYLYDPNSPMRNETLYQYVLEDLVNSETLPDYEKLRKKSLLTLIQRNTVGQQAENFKYMTPDGKTHSLRDLKADHLLLFFYEPGCPSCAQTIQQIQASPKLSQLIEQRHLTVLAIYPDGMLDTWKEKQDFIPTGWTNGIDKTQQILTEELYDLKASPTIYLLDKEQNVLLKDVFYEDLERYNFSK